MVASSKYEVHLLEPELALLRKLIGKHLDTVWTNGWSVKVCASGMNLVVYPEEVATPSPSHEYADVDRPAVSPGEPDLSEVDTLVGRDFGSVIEITLLRGRMIFSPKVEAPPVEILGKQILGGDQYGLLFLDPDYMEIAAPTDAAVVSADLAIELSMLGGRVLTLFTWGIGHFVESVVDGPLPPELGLHLRRHRIAMDS